MSDPSNLDILPPEPPNLRFLRRLVTTLMVVMIGGLLVIVAVIVIRFSNPRGAAAPLSLPDQVALPAGVGALAITAAGDWYAVVTDDNRILVFDRATGALRQTVEILAAP